MFRLAFLFLFAALTMGAVPACAQQEWGAPQPLDRLLPQIRERHPGTFYDAEGPYSDENGGMHYRLKWMTPEGRIIWLDTDARTGRVLGVDRGGFRGRDFVPPPRDAYPPDRARRFEGPVESGNPYRGKPVERRSLGNHWENRGGAWNNHASHGDHHGGY